MNACCNDQANATMAPSCSGKGLVAGYQMAIVGHLLGPPLDARPHQHAIGGGGQGTKPKRYGGVSVPYNSRPVA